jgi:signal transduction histidine kinase
MKKAMSRSGSTSKNTLSLQDPLILEALLEKVGQTGVFVVGKDARIVYGSARGLRLLRLPTKASVIGNDFYSLAALRDHQGNDLPVYKLPVYAALQPKRFVQLTPFFCSRKNGTKQTPIALTVTQLRKGANTYGAIIELREATRKLNLDEMKSLFLSFAAHQLKTPSSIVKGFLELLLREDKKSFKATQWDHIVSAHAANEQLIKISKTLLNLTKLEGGLIEPQISVCNIKEILEQKIAAHKTLLDAKHLKVALKTGTISAFETDPVFFSELFDILFSNAIKYAPEKTQIIVEAIIQDDEIKLQVTDKGKALSPEVQKELFSTARESDPYQNSHGLGLFMAQKYLMLLRGSIGVFSSPKKDGNTFYFTIPAPL